MAMKLKELIRAVRACKTAAEERGVITKECAMIRTAIKATDKSMLLSFFPSPCRGLVLGTSSVPVSCVHG